jgi:hypothetical protein
MLNSILAVTICAPDPAAAEAAYNRYLSYETVDRNPISPQLAARWNAPRMAGRASRLMRPASGEPVFLRFVEAEPAAAYSPMKTAGWNAVELLVASPDALAETLAHSPFRIIGPPRGLSSNEAIRAMQAIGPAGELLYLTCIPPGESAYNLQSAKSEVDRAFIVVAGGQDLSAMRAFYAEHLKLPVSPPMGVRVSVLSNAYGLEAERLHDLSVVRLPASCLIELDQYPSEAWPRPCRAGELPPGIAAVALNAASLGDFEGVAIPDQPYNGRRVGLVTGAAGEIIELVAE